MKAECLEDRHLLSAPHHALLTTPPRYDHVVVVIEENHSFNPILGQSIWPPTAFPGFEWPFIPPLPLETDPYIRHLASTGAIFTNSSGIAHPSQPNYLALFSGSTQAVTSDATPPTLFNAPNLSTELTAAEDSFAGYFESIGQVGYTGEDRYGYVRHHNPLVDFSNVPPSQTLPMADFPRRFRDLPTVSLVVPNLYDDMHSDTVLKADHWLKKHLGGYAAWAHTHNSLLIVTWDESGPGSGNHIPTFFVGAHVRRGKFAEPINHFNVLRTIEDMYGLPSTANAATAAPITNVFRG